jgi:hypothetical protein
VQVVGRPMVSWMDTPASSARFQQHEWKTSVSTENAVDPPSTLFPGCSKWSRTAPLPWSCRRPAAFAGVALTANGQSTSCCHTAPRDPWLVAGALWSPPPLPPLLPLLLLLLVLPLSKASTSSCMTFCAAFQHGVAAAAGNYCGLVLLACLHAAIA